jgi:hypothetical protein
LILFAVPVRHLLTGERDGLGVLRRTSRAGSTGHWCARW